MTLKQLVAFYWICHLGSFSAAASRLHTTQSAISMRIRELEDQLGVQLLDREPRNTRPTLKGRELLSYVTQILTLIEQITHKVGDPNVLSVDLTLGVTEFVAITWLADLLHAINTAYPDVRIELDVGLTNDQLRKLVAGEIDIAILPGPVELEGVEQVDLGEVEFRWMASPQLGVPRSLPGPEELARWPILATVPSSNLYRVMSRFMGSDIHKRNTTICNTIGVMGSLALAGLGIGFLPCDHYADHIQANRLQLIDVDPVIPPLRYFAVYDQRRSVALIQLICQLAQATSHFDKSRIMLG